jgi:hypothetical protein
MDINPYVMFRVGIRQLRWDERNRSMRTPLPTVRFVGAGCDGQTGGR